MTEAVLFELLSLDCRVDADGSVRYYNAQGQLHREYGPAIKYADGTLVWYQNGQLHRPDGPAIVCTLYRAWHQKGRLHRQDGPAFVNANGCCEWFINGQSLTQAEWQQTVASMEAV